MRISAIVLALGLATMSMAQDHFKFVVTGDGRWETKGGRPGDENGVNVTGMRRLVAAILQEKPAVLLFTGDTVGGTKDDDAQASQFKTWLNVMKPAYDAGIHVLVGRGNHEIHCPHANDVWRAAFSGPYANPGGGPAGEEDMTYAFTYGNAVFISLDQFQTKEPVINQAWLDKTLADNKQLHIFPFAHKMAFRVAHHVDGMDENVAARDKFMDSIANAGGRTFFCGHDHLYDHTAVTLPGWSDDKAIHQYVVGTAGAPFYTGTDHGGQNGAWKLNTLGHVEGKLGYCLVEVDGPKVTLTFKAENEKGAFEDADKFSYSVAAPR